MKYFFFFIFILSIFSINSCTSFKKAPNKYDAYVMMKKFVDDKLLSPSSAEYEPISTIGLKQEGNIWAFDGYVDSQNSFGVMIRNNFSIAIRYNPSTDDWSLVNLFFHE